MAYTVPMSGTFSEPGIRENAIEILGEHHAFFIAG
jgi:hypothetical protein